MKTLKFKIIDAETFAALMMRISDELPKVKRLDGLSVKSRQPPENHEYPVGVSICLNLLKVERIDYYNPDYIMWKIGQSLFDNQAEEPVSMDLGIICYEDRTIHQVQVLRKIEYLFPNARWESGSRPMNYIPVIDGGTKGQNRLMILLRNNVLTAIPEMHLADALVVCNAIDFIKPDWKYIPPAPQPEQQPQEDISDEEFEAKVDNLVKEFKTVIMNNYHKRLAKKGEKGG